MKSIIFTPPTDQKILTGEKTMTARLWKQRPPKPGDFVAAQTSRRKDTLFATLEIIGVWEWGGGIGYCGDLPYSHQTIAKKEGFTSWDAFWGVYKFSNLHHWDDPDRKHYFVEFKTEKCRVQDTQCAFCGWADPHDNFQFKLRSSDHVVCDSCAAAILSAVPYDFSTEYNDTHRVYHEVLQGESSYNSGVLKANLIPINSERQTTRCQCRLPFRAGILGR